MRYQPMSERSAFPHIAAIVFVVLLLIGAAGLGLLWHSLEEYERTTPQGALRPVVTALEQNDMDTLARLCHVDKSRFFDDAQYPAYIQQTLGGDRSGLRIAEDGTDASGAKTCRIVAKGGALELRLRPQEGGGYIVEHTDIPLKTYRICLPEDAEVTVNGRTLTAAERTSQRQPVGSFATLDAALVPHNVEYEVSGFADKPEVTLAGAADYQLQETEDAFLFTVHPPEETRAEYAALAEEAARRYALYVSNDLEFTELSPLLYADSEFYRTVRRIDRSWYIAHETPEFLDLRVENIAAYSADHFTAEVEFDYKVVSDKKTTQVMKNHYRLAFLRTADGFRLANLEFI